MEEIFSQVSNLGLFAGFIMASMFGAMRILIKREYTNVHKRLDEHDRALYGDKDDPINKPGLISQFNLMIERQNAIANKIDELPSKVAAEIKNQKE